MKKSKLKIYTALLFSLFLLTTCRQEEPNLFPDSPAERLNKAMSDYRSLLIEAPNGWKMDYFANPESPGYTLLVKFNKSGNALMASRSKLTTGQAYETDSCLFDIIADYGPILTFNTFSKILHVFSNPENPSGYGLQGDYEFIITKASADTVVLKGKKYKAEVLLSKLISETQWQQFADNLHEFSALLFSETTPDLRLKIGKKYYAFSDGASGIFTVKHSASNSSSFDIPFIVTQDGIRLYREIEIEGIKFKTFKLNDSKTGLTSIESPEYTLLGVDDLATFFIEDPNVSWNFVTADFSPDLNQHYQDIIQSVKSLYAADEVAFSLQFNKTRNNFVLVLSYTAGTYMADGMLDLNINLINKDLLSISYQGSGNEKGLQFYNEVTGLRDFLSTLSATFELSTTIKINPQKIKFVKDTDLQCYFSISK